MDIQELDRHTVQLRAREIGLEHMRRAGRTELTLDDKIVASDAFKRLLLIVPQHLGGWEGKSETELLKIGVDRSDISDAMYGRVTLENPLPETFQWPQAQTVAA